MYGLCSDARLAAVLHKHRVGGGIDSTLNTTINKKALKKSIAALKRGGDVRVINEANVVNAHSPLKCALNGLKSLERCGDSNIAERAKSLRSKGFIGGSYEDWAGKTESERREQLRINSATFVVGLFRSWGSDVARLVRGAEDLLEVENRGVKVVGEKKNYFTFLSVGINFLRLSGDLSAFNSENLIDAKLSSMQKFVVAGCQSLLKYDDKDLAKEAALLKMDVGDCALLGGWSEGKESEKETLSDAGSDRPENHLAQIHLLGLKVAKLIKHAEEVQRLAYNS